MDLSMALCFFSAITAVNLLHQVQGVPLVPREGGLPIMLSVRGKRGMQVQPYYQRNNNGMIFTGYYLQPPAQRTGVFAQGDSIRAGTYFVEKNNPVGYQQFAPEPSFYETNVANSQAKAGPDSHQIKNHHHHETFTTENDIEHQSSISTTSEASLEITTVKQEDISTSVDPPKSHDKPSKDKKKIKGDNAGDDNEDDDDDDDKVGNQNDENESNEEEEEEEEEEDDDQESSPFVPFRASPKRRNNIPNLNNFFPMVFRFPKSYGRSDGKKGGSSPRMITAIANSYSTGKGGVASSVATAYGGESSQGNKKKRSKSSTE